MLLLVVTMVTSAALWLVWMLVPTPADATARRPVPGADLGYVPAPRPGRAPLAPALPARGTNRGALVQGPVNGRAKGGVEPTPLDPFEALQVQARLSAVLSNVRELEEDPHAYARTTRLLACQLAYDALLAEACGLAGIRVDREGPLDEVERFREEVELTARGWTW
nr:hypothetical protein [Cellulomonas endophytica]